MGRYARLLEGAEAIEIKATVPQKQVKAALARYGLTQTQRRTALHLFLRHAAARPAQGRHHRPRAPHRRRRARQHDQVPAGRRGEGRQEVAQVPRLQDRGGREREGHREVGIVLDAGGEGPHQACRRRREGHRGAVHRGAGGVPGRNGRLGAGSCEALDPRTTDGPALGLRGSRLPLADHGRTLDTGRTARR